MENILILQIIVGLCFTGIIIILFMESKDYLIYSLVFIFIVAISTYFLKPGSMDNKEDVILAIDWEVIVFLFCLFCIVEILNEQKIFHQFAIIIVNKFHGKPRLLFYILSIVSTLIATIIEDLSVAIIFIPIVIEACRKMKINPIPYMYGVTICINLASTLTPFGSAENIIIANRFNLDLHWHIIYLGIYFIFSLAITLFLLDRLILTKYLKEYNDEFDSSIPGYLDLKDLQSDNPKKIHLTTIEVPHSQQIKLIEVKSTKKILAIEIEKKAYKKNLVGLVIFIIILSTIRSIVVAGILGLMLFIFLNPIKIRNGKKEPSLSNYLHRIDAKLIYFFIILFLIVYFMELAELTIILENLIENLTQHNTFLLSIGILIISSLLSGLMDDAPITILFLPIIADIISTNQYISNPIFIAFTLGINLGGNFLPQGAACDMMTLELARKHKVKGFTYKNFVIVGGFFAIIHILLGIGYIYLYLLIF
ncbi:SLC13 family permease [Promethearchaeum syntrophicum]|uniref:SLC13 family permease n=1 Tax=Promethearchaeum syntrophicum TaxID=2594042 RepID=A0A5B9DD80_9ARCH|nr:SLC13 family permease [Candidatus Prometheoarchaeum syntrophicum]QEE16730.1 Citrate transporter [Candidatus Prometheoarchaeum syntrophicum]